MTVWLRSFCGFSGIITYISKLFWTDGWIEFLRDKLNNEDFIIALQNSPCSSGPLVKSMPVGHRSIKEIDNIFIDMSFSDVGLMHWLYNFFKDTKRFALDEPNTHMVGCGRWEKEIGETDFL